MKFKAEQYIINTDSISWENTGGHIMVCSCNVDLYDADCNKKSVLAAVSDDSFVLYDFDGVFYNLTDDDLDDALYWKELPSATVEQEVNFDEWNDLGKAMLNLYKFFVHSAGCLK